MRQSLFICIGGLEFLRNIKDKSLEERAMEFNGDLMLDGEYDWGELVGREKI